MLIENVGQVGTQRRKVQSREPQLWLPVCGREGAGKWELEREHWGDCRAGGAAGTDATSGSLQKAGLQQGWMLTTQLARGAFSFHDGGKVKMLITDKDVFSDPGQQ